MTYTIADTYNAFGYLNDFFKKFTTDENCKSDNFRELFKQTFNDLEFKVFHDDSTYDCIKVSCGIDIKGKVVLTFELFQGEVEDIRTLKNARFRYLYRMEITDGYFNVMKKGDEEYEKPAKEIIAINYEYIKDYFSERREHILWDAYNRGLNEILGQDCRVCSECGGTMYNGYIINEGDEYYCSDECLHKHYTEQEYQEAYNEGWGYWSEWD